MKHLRGEIRTADNGKQYLYLSTDGHWTYYEFYMVKELRELKSDLTRIQKMMDDVLRKRSRSRPPKERTNSDRR